MNYQSCLREAARSLKEHSEDIQKGRLLIDGQFDDKVHRSIRGRTGVLIEKMGTELKKECERLGAWGVMDDGTGGRLVNKGTNEPVELEELIGK